MLYYDKFKKEIDMKYILIFLISLIPTLAFCETLITCTTQTEHAFFPNMGMIQKSNAGWMTGNDPGTITVQKLSDGSYDILFIDATKSIHSAKENGAQIKLLWKDDLSTGISVFYPNHAIEIYNFTKENTGKYVVTILTATMGSSLIYKSSVENGICDSSLL